MTFDNIKSNKKPGFHPVFRRYILEKTTGKGIDTAPIVDVITTLYLL